MWAKDGSGLRVKRIRGMTIPQMVQRFGLSTAGGRAPRRARYSGASCYRWTMRHVWRCQRKQRAERKTSRAWAKFMHKSLVERIYSGQCWLRNRWTNRKVRRSEIRWELESTARTWGLDLQLGELSRDLRARMTSAMDGTAERENRAAKALGWSDEQVQELRQKVMGLSIPNILSPPIEADLDDEQYVQQIKAKWTGAFAGPCQGICCNPRAHLPPIENLDEDEAREAAGWTTDR
jgi:hypothetical protein